MLKHEALHKKADVAVKEGRIMKTKKSLQEAIERAAKFSKGGPNPVRVMDKKYKRSRMCASNWVYNQLILEGWETVCTFIDGKRQAD